ncbi:MAG: polysaccharide biosynthesis tyrosine autokinase [Burkholderiales bacterium]
MERIKEALDRARKERGSDLTWLDGGSNFNAAIKPVATRLAEIIYTQTRIVSPSHKRLVQNRIISDQEQNPYSDVYKVLRTQVLRKLGERGANTLAVTSPGPGEGKSLTALNLAISMAMELDKTVLLVDTDLRNPSLHRLLGLGDVPGLADFLTSDMALSDLLIHPSIPRLVILPAGNRISNSAEMLSSHRMAKLVQEIKTRYPSRYVIFDLPPLLNVADASVFAPLVEAAIMVVEEGVTQGDAVKRAATLLPQNKLIGTVLNKVHQMESSYGYYGKKQAPRLFARLLRPRSI